MVSYQFLSFLALILTKASCHSFGPPVVDSVCIDLLPSPLSPHRQQPGNGSYYIKTNATLNDTVGYFNYTAGETYFVTVASQVAITTFKGFLIQAWDPSDTKIGSFAVTDPSAQKLLDCSTVDNAYPAHSTISHARVNNKTEQTVMWKAPPGGNGLVDFRFTLVRSYTEFYGPLSAASPNGTIKSDRPPLPINVTLPVRAAEDYRIRARIPRGCSGDGCLTFVGVDTNAGNDKYLDIYLEGKAEAWVAVGFALTPHMKNAAVVACNYNPNYESLEALDTYNPPDRKTNILQPVQRNYLREGCYEDGRINCTISREIEAGGGIDHSYLNESLYLLFGVGQNRASEALLQHSLHLINIPQVSQEPIIPASGEGNFGADTIYPPILTRLHGILMWLSWPVLGCTGIFYALWMRPRMPRGRWFLIHVSLMLFSLVTGFVGVACIFGAQYRKKGLIDFADIASSIYHFSFGIIVLAFMLFNPIIALLRCKPESSLRWIFNLMHGYGIGLIAQTLAIINIGLGTIAYDYAMGSAIKLYWVYAVFVFAFVMVNLGLTVNYLLGSIKTKDEGSEQTSLLTSINGIQDSHSSNTTQTSFMWGILVGYLVLVCILTLTWIILVSM